jgi:hypothetical protein
LIAPPPSACSAAARTVGGSGSDEDLTSWMRLALAAGMVW